MPVSPSRPRGARIQLSSFATAAVLMTGLLTGLLPATGPEPAAAVAPSPNRILLGVAGDVADARLRTGQRLAAHRYGYFERKAPLGRMLTVRFQRFTPWRSTAALRPGSAGYAHVARWADDIRDRKRRIYVAFHHEPESSGNSRYGTSADYRAAYRRVVDIFRARGATNAIFTWQMTAWAFRADVRARNAAIHWYPGSTHVDVVGADPYNWYTCGHGRNRWNSLQELVDPVIAFARPRGKQVVLPEFASLRHPWRDEWLVQAGHYMARNDSVIAAAFYFHRSPTNRSNADCTWPLTSRDDFAALALLASAWVYKP